LNPILLTVLIFWLISGVGLVLFVLLHSGKGTGLSDIIAGQVYNNPSGTSIVEKNLDRITVVLAVVFFTTLLVLMVIYPKGIMK